MSQETIVIRPLIACNFNQFCTRAIIGYDREAFHRWARAYLGTNYRPGMLMRVTDWWDVWDRFVLWQDAEDLHDTQQDSLGTLW
jgi:hypothetical protein